MQVEPRATKLFEHAVQVIELLQVMQESSRVAHAENKHYSQFNEEILQMQRPPLE